MCKDHQPIYLAEPLNDYGITYTLFCMTSSHGPTFLGILYPNTFLLKLSAPIKQLMHFLHSRFGSYNV